MNTISHTDLNGNLETIIASYEDRIQNIQVAFQSSEVIVESSYVLINSVRDSLIELEKERKTLNSKLCNTMARNGSLRKKDYNNIMSGILSVLDTSEKEMERQFYEYMESQKEISELMRNSLLGLKGVTTQEIGTRVMNVRKQLSGIADFSERKKDRILKSYTDFLTMHMRTMDSLRELLKKRDTITIKDIKNIKNQIAL